MLQESAVVVVAGGSGAIGKAIIECLQNKYTCSILATYCKNPGPNDQGIRWVKFDANEPHNETFTEAVDGMESRLLGIIYCIGIPSTKRQIADSPFDEWLYLYTVNALGLVKIYQAVRGLARRSRSRVLAISSDTTRVVGSGNGVYTASKSALEVISQTLAKEELAYGVSVNVLSPCLVDSPLAKTILRLKEISDYSAYSTLLPWGRMLTVREVAGIAVSMLIEEDYSYMTGQVVRLAADI